MVNGTPLRCAPLAPVTTGVDMTPHVKRQTPVQARFSELRCPLMMGGSGQTLRPVIVDGFHADIRGFSPPYFSVVKPILRLGTSVWSEASARLPNARRGLLHTSRPEAPNRFRQNRTRPLSPAPPDTPGGHVPAPPRR